MENTAGNSALLFLPTAFWTAAPFDQFFISSSIPSKKSAFCLSTLFSLNEACYPDWHTFAVPEILFVPLSIKNPCFSGVFVSAKRFELLTNGLKESLG
jgi:hypothetical protein